MTTSTPIIYSTVDWTGLPASLFRIPALAITNNGTLVTCYDSRNISPADIPNNVDIVCRRSTNYGYSWEPRKIVALHGGDGTQAGSIGMGDPCLIYDPSVGVNGRLFCHYAYSPVGIGWPNSGYGNSVGSTNTLHPYVKYSDDHGVTWSAGEDLIASIKNNTMTGVFASGGKGVQLSNGSLLIPYCWKDGSGQYAGYVISNDHGVTWSRVASVLGSGIDEHKVIQLNDQSLFDTGRPLDSSGVRKFSRASSIAGPWSTVNSSLPDPKCNGDVIRVDPVNGNSKSSWLLHSNCNDVNLRRNLTVYLSVNNGSTWPYSIVIEPGLAAYSTMIMMPDGSVGCFYEKGDQQLTFARFHVDIFGA